MSESRTVDQITPLGAAFSVLHRDVYVTWKELMTFLAQVILQPLFLLFVFGRILADLGYTRHGYTHLLFPGIVGMTVVLTALQSTALPLVFDFSFTKEIEDRLLAPLPVGYVAMEKIAFASLRGLTAGVVMFPIGLLVLGSIPWRGAGIAPMIGAMVLGAIVGSSLGLVLGTLVPPQRISLMFSVVLTPVLFTGCSQYPWPSLARLRWFQVVTAANPITYVSELMRDSLVPEVPHIDPLICLGALLVAVGVFGYIGTRGFLKRAVD